LELQDNLKLFFNGKILQQWDEHFGQPFSSAEISRVGKVSVNAILYTLRATDSDSVITQILNPFGNALIPDRIADASIQEIDGVFYCYATIDGYDQGLRP
jgi:hypothetical protein